jgi:hypothetical protein
LLKAQNFSSSIEGENYMKWYGRRSFATKRINNFSAGGRGRGEERGEGEGKGGGSFTNV